MTHQIRKYKKQTITHKKTKVIIDKNKEKKERQKGEQGPSVSPGGRGVGKKKQNENTSRKERQNTGKEKERINIKQQKATNSKRQTSKISIRKKAKQERT